MLSFIRQPTILGNPPTHHLIQSLVDFLPNTSTHPPTYLPTHHTQARSPCTPVLPPPNPHPIPSSKSPCYPTEEEEEEEEEEE